MKKIGVKTTMRAAARNGRIGFVVRCFMSWYAQNAVASQMMTM